MLKRGFRRGRRSVRRHFSDGSVSIFLIVILAAVFMFVAVFIDYARIAAMKVQTERLARAAVRSVMSAYDPVLQQRYGLFAYGETDGNMIMGNVLNDSLNPGDRGDAFQLMAMRVDSSGLELERPLGSYEVFNRMIGEDMKYKAPIDFTLELVQKFKPMSQAMKEASNTVDVLGKLQKLYDRREDALNEMLEKQRKAAESALPLPKLIMDPPGAYIYDASLSGFVYMASDAAAQYADYMSKVEEDARRPEDEDKLYTSLIQDYEFGVSVLSSQISARLDKASSTHDELLTKAEQLWTEAQSLNEEMKRVIQEAEDRNTNVGYDTVTNDQTLGNSGSSGEDAALIRSIREKTDQLLRSDELLNGLRQEIHGQKRKYAAVQSGVSSVASSAGRSENKGQVMQTSRQLDSYLQEYAVSGSANILDRQWAQLDESRAADKERKAAEKLAKQKLNEAANVLSALNGLEGQNELMDEFRKLQQYYDESLQFNREPDEARSRRELGSNPYDAGKSAMNGMDGIFGSMGSILEGAGEELFQNEYAVHYYQHFDIGKLSEVIQNPSAGSRLADELRVANQEVEYILYGFHNPIGNISSAYAEIFATRLAIRTMEGLVVNSKLGNPLVVLAAAILYGIEKSIEDMLQLVQKGSIPLSKYVPVQLTYRDHLRLFLLLHSNNERKMSRMLALIRFNTGINPADRSTYASGEVTMAMRLWFLPGITNVLGTAIGDSGEVQGNRYVFSRRADFSY
ncbi:hypothetical protein GNP94_20305 [Paenibacillus campinasensis]|uniref:Flp pilus-assembly TadG-like N-terminal domain-containing protein n=1 Tax=Paenibacillus campinasensis TaxID=66347 RepID=A0ABW9T5E2_9BACL|nr:hypothetical protein [Paenibacillus campinasensis]MUG68324.1 hypothetical protein [Paenibacillus campinasensis]